MARMNGEVASVLVDLSLRQDAPDPQLPTIGWAFVDMKSPRPDGLPSAAEKSVLYEIEEAICDGLAEHQAVLAGVVGSAGRREFYFYLPSADAFAMAVDQAMTAFPAYTYHRGSQPDPSWNHYLEVLYPNPIELEIIKNGQLVALLKSKGDTMEASRVVDHFAYFVSRLGRDQFSKWATREGFAVEDSDKDDFSSSHPYGIQASREDTLMPDSINGLTITLIERAAEFNGIYDGWGCPITKGPA